MIRNLLIISAAALVLCLASLGGAAALGGRDLAEHDWTWIVTDDGHDNGSVRFERGSAAAIQGTRTLAWTGGESLTVDLPAEVTFVQGDKAGVVIEGDKEYIQRIRLVGGRLVLDEDEAMDRGVVRLGPSGLHVTSASESLRITVTAPKVTSFRLAGSGDLDIENYDQPVMDVLIDGSGDLEAVGRAQSLQLRVNGSGDADLGGLTLGDASVDVPGSGDVVVGPTGKAHVEIDGSGDVTLTRRPRELERDISGSGEVHGA